MAVAMGNRVMIEDARNHGGFLRATWHPEARQFVVSIWEGSVCVAATRVTLADAPHLVAVLVDGMADAATPSAPQAATGC